MRSNISNKAKIKKRKKVVPIVIITKKEMEYLQSKGLTFDRYEGDLHTTHSKYHKYYMTETPRNMRLLQDYRESCVVSK